MKTPVGQTSVPAEFVFQDTLFGAAEIDVIVRRKGVEIASSGIVLVVAHAPVTLDATVHLMIDERAQVLVREGAFAKAVASVGMAGHDGHVLEVAFPTLVADGTIVRVVCHEPFDDARTELARLFIFDRDPHAIHGRHHAGHDDLSPLVLLIPVLTNGALAAGADRSECGMPAEVRQVESEGEAHLEEVFSRLGFVRFTVDLNSGHGESQVSAFFW